MNMQTEHETQAAELAKEYPEGVQACWWRAARSLTHASWLQNPAVKWPLAVVAGLLFAAVISVPLDLQEQMIFSAVTFIVAMLMRKMPGRLITLFMVVLSLTASTRYMYWRLTDTIGFDNFVDIVFGFGLVMAELYAFVVLLIGYFQTAWPLQRKPVPMPQDITSWPSVDVFIPTYNEPWSVVKQTVFGAMAMDWPADRLRVYVLDDGKRTEFRDLCVELGVGYLTRNNNAHAKAGNLNEALKVTDGDFIAIFDCDHIPTRSFLQVSVGWFLRDEKLAMLQTPHVFFSPDPFEKNLDTFRSIPNEGELFYGIVQDGNDLWNASFFCGSCAVLRRGPLLEVGGVAVETVTEDAHTALKLNRLGYNTAYLELPQAAGLATESLSAHVGQRIRWARGMAQIARVDNPLLGPGLKFGQRLCYLNAMLHFFYGFPRLVFLTAPLAYLLFDAELFQASALMITAYALPHLAHASITNSRIQGRFRHSFWNEVYESVLAWYILRPVLFALINPKLGKFNVTAKGGTVAEAYFDWVIARPYLILVGLNALGFAVGGIRMLTNPSDEIPTLIINMVWTIYNLVLVSASLAVASETRQIRITPRVMAVLPAILHTPDGKAIRSETEDFSQHGLGLTVPSSVLLSHGSQVEVSLSRSDLEATFPAVVTFSGDGRLGLQFDNLSLRQQAELSALTFSRADAWLSLWGQKTRDKPLTSLGDVMRTGVRGISQLTTNMAQSLRVHLAERSKKSSSIT
jgi:cellulose synthase (UDP-forming)